MENRLKELQQGVAMEPDQLLAVTANQLRLLSAVATYVLFQTLQSFARATALGSAQGWKLRERLVKIAVWVERSVRRIYLESWYSGPSTVGVGWRPRGPAG
jgi:Transposase DDE domain group 1